MNAITHSYNEALNHCLSGHDLITFMFIEGMKYQKTGEIRKDPLEEKLKEYEINIKKNH